MERRQQQQSQELEERLPNIRSEKLDRLLEECSSRRHELEEELQKELEKEQEHDDERPCLLTIHQEEGIEQHGYSFIDDPLD